MPFCCIEFGVICRRGSIRKTVNNPYNPLSEKYSTVYNEDDLNSALELQLGLYDDNSRREWRHMGYCPFCGKKVHGEILSN